MAIYIVRVTVTFASAQRGAVTGYVKDCDEITSQDDATRYTLGEAFDVLKRLDASEHVDVQSFCLERAE